jgi:hypothetical protein
MAWHHLNFSNDNRRPPWLSALRLPALPLTDSESKVGSCKFLRFYGDALLLVTLYPLSTKYFFF